MKSILAGGLAGAIALLLGTAPPIESQPAEALQGTTAPAGGVWLDTLDFTDALSGAPLRSGRSSRNTPLAVRGVTYQHGLGVGANSEQWFDLGGRSSRFLSVAGIDDVWKTGVGSVQFQVWLDGKRVFDSGNIDTVYGGSPRTVFVDADLTGAQRMVLVVGDSWMTAPSIEAADWAGAVVIGKDQRAPAVRAMRPPDDPAPQIASRVPAEPRINGPRVTVATPGRPFLFLIPATGDRPLTYAATGLPPGLALDAMTGVMSGSLAGKSAWRIPLRVHGAKGDATGDLTIVSGRLAQTPPMGWNSWNVWAGAVDDAKVRAAADGMVKSGLAAHGYQYINIDDTWEAGRDAKGEIQTNKKFPDMKALADYVHSKGLKLGIYSSPGPKTCAGFEGSYQHEAQDAATYAQWGIDYLKYDWCSYGDIVGPKPSLNQLQQPYFVMREALDKTGRDIVYSLCQYGMGKVWEWGDQVGGNLWRTTGDITDTWQSLASIGFNQSGHEPFAGPGHWNDPDMLVVGKVGWGPNIHPTRLTPNEQITHITLWSLLAAPLLIGADMSALDRFTTDLLSNDEVLAVDQEPFGRQAMRIARDGWTEVWGRQLGDGSYAVGLFNRGPYASTVTVKWSDIPRDMGIVSTIPHRVRELWVQKDVGSFSRSYTSMVPRHGAVMLRIEQR